MSALEARGGVVGRSDLAARWGISRQRVAQLVALDGFPEPVLELNGQPGWAVDDVEAWRAARPGPGRRPAGQGPQA